MIYEEKVKVKEGISSMGPIGESLLTSLFPFLLICIGLYVQKET